MIRRLRTLLTRKQPKPERLDMELIAALVTKAGHAAYVEQTGGGCATIYASRVWGPYEKREGGLGFYRYPEMHRDNGSEQRFEVAAGPGWFEPHWAAPDSHAYANASDFSVAVDDDGESDAIDCTGMDEASIAVLIIGKFREVRLL